MYKEQQSKGRNNWLYSSGNRGMANKSLENEDALTMRAQFDF